MEKLHFYSILLPLFLLQFPSFVLSLNYTLPDKYFINCGSNSMVTVDYVRNFIGDRSFIVGVSTTAKNTNPSSTNSLYQTARFYKKPFSFEFEINQKGPYLVRLHFFAFTSHTNLADAVFNVSTLNLSQKKNVSTSGFSLLSNFSVRNRSNSLVIKDFLLTIDVGKFRIYFMPVQNKSLAFVNAIEVFLVPDDFLRDDQLRITPVGLTGTLHSLLSQGYRTVHRVNVGGQLVNDPLWRNWIPDYDYLFPGASAKNCDFYSGNLAYEEVFGPTEHGEKVVGATSYSAPDLVYKTCREVSEGSNFSNITWRFNVSKGARHLVRAHFCDIISKSPNILNFSLSIYNNFTQLIDPYEYTDKTAAPFYLDFVVDSDESGFINISVRTREDTMNKFAYLNGLEIMEFMKPYSGPFPPEPDQNKKKTYIIIGSVSGAAIVFILIMVCLLVLVCRKKSKPVESMHSVYMPPYGGGWSPYNGSTEKTATSSLVPNLNLKLKMSLAEVLDATQNFDTKLLIGEGGFGKVYKGTLRSGEKVAVKRSDSRHGQGFPEFRTEIILLSKIRNRHLVSLIGYCDEGSEMILVYEFMENGTLREHLYNSTWNSDSSSTLSKLTWKQRLEICIGSAKGLLYLHTGVEGGIIHRDVKTTNILLDEHYVAKVADFGLSTSIPLDPDDFSMGIKGSVGYLDPEYFRCLQFTDKSDVYSFGVVLLEVLCARPAVINSSRREEVNLAEWGMFWQRKGKLEEIIDPLLVGQINPNSLRKFGEIVEKCLKANGADRPAMCDVMWDLEYALLLQQTAVLREPHEDSTADASSNLEMPVVRRLPSNNFPVEEDDVSMGQNSGSQPDRGVFSQLSFAGGR